MIKMLRNYHIKLGWNSFNGKNQIEYCYLGSSDIKSNGVDLI